ncbi:MAG: phytoene desaturase, partial [Verrucomicrobiaceae bacterium]
SLAQEGYRVTIHEKNGRIGGKLNVLVKDGYTFDLGPSILTLPHIFQRLFERSGRQMVDYVSLRPVRPHWRNFFEDGMTIDLHPDPAVMALEAAKAGEDPSAVEAFLRYSAKLYDLVNDGYFEKGLDDTGDFAKHYGFWRSTGFDLLRRMHGGGARFLKTERMRDIFDYFIKYVGSSAYRAPAFMNCLPTIQFRYDLWYVDGGMYGMALGLGRLIEELGVEVVLDSPVTAIRKDGDRVTGIEIADGSFHAADIIVSNVEVIPTYRHLLKEDAEFMESLEKFEPSCSGLVLELGLDTTYPQLAHHNFFFSEDQRAHFRAVFEERRLPDDPTIYLVAAGRTDPTVAPPGCDTIKILPHIPHLRDDQPLSADDYAAFKERVLDKLERMGLRDLRKHTVVEHLWTPHDIREQYGSNQGSIYGVVCDRDKNFGFKPPKHSTRYDNLFFAGGSTNPGGGMPMVVLSGQNVAREIAKWDRK